MESGPMESPHFYKDEIRGEIEVECKDTTVICQSVRRLFRALPTEPNPQNSSLHGITIVTTMVGIPK